MGNRNCRAFGFFITVGIANPLVSSSSKINVRQPYKCFLLEK
jgi:hypothetical protein